ncbi:MAG TPA: integrase arm-type DNA-binding domain-containing protein [Casimicrobiaceae bacterium]
MHKKALTHKDIEHAKPNAAAPFRLWAGGGLYVEVRPSGAKLWRVKYRYGGKDQRVPKEQRRSVEKVVALGEFPALSLTAAKSAAREIKDQLAAGKDPAELRKTQRVTEAAEQEQKRANAAISRREAIETRARLRATKRSDAATFSAMAEEWHTLHAKTWTAVHSAGVWQSIEDHAIPSIGSKLVAEVVPADVLAILAALLNDGKIETADRLKQRLGAIFRYAAIHKLVTGDPTAVVKDQYAALKRQLRKSNPKQHHASLTPRELGEFVKRMRAIYATPIVTSAFWLLLLTATRTGEVRGAKWTEFKGLDGDNPEWNIPGERMKSRRPHWVPLSTQAATILRQLKPITKEYGYVFPIVTRTLATPKPISENAILYFITKSAGYAGQMTGHGCRTLFSTWANESGQWRSEVIEKQLAHAETDNTKAAYDRSEHRETRRKLLQAWADYIDALAIDNVVPMKAAKAAS